MSKLKKALIFGVTGQDGAYLARFLLNHNYQVSGVTRNASIANTINLDLLGVREGVEVLCSDISNFESLKKIVDKTKPDEIYMLSGQSSISKSIQDPRETVQSICDPVLNVLEVIRIYPQMKLFFASSSEVFGDLSGRRANENTRLNPANPYASAKVFAQSLVKNYREQYGIFACSGILYNHESILRSEQFVTQKIIIGAAQVKAGIISKVKLGNMDVIRDWGWAPEYVEAMWLMLQQETADDFIIGTGESVGLDYFAQRAFSYFGLNWRDHVLQEKSLIRVGDIKSSFCDPGKASQSLGWVAEFRVNRVVDKMSEAAYRKLLGDEQWKDLL